MLHKISALTTLLLILFMNPVVTADESKWVSKAVATLTVTSSVTGTVTFKQSHFGGPVTVKGHLKGLDPNALRGFHVHQSGNLTGGCTSAGPHYNPFNATHGAPYDDPKHRHVGDLGNIESDAKGEAKFTIKDHLLTLNGPLSIVGRSIVVHTGTDDLGRGGNPDSLLTGNSGTRAACGVIA